jgi:hypothetical protein
MMRSRQRAKPTRDHPAGKGFVPRRARLGLNIARLDFYHKGGMAYAEHGAKIANRSCLSRTGAAQAVVYRCCLNPARHGRSRQQQQRSAIRPARNGNAQADL